MRNKWRRAIAVFSVVLLMLPLFSGLAIAGENSSSSLPGQTSAAPEISLEKAIQIVKNNFEVPNEYTDFSSAYNTSDDRQAWSLNWNASSGPGGQFAAEVSALNGDILSINYWQNNDQTSASSSPPAITKLRAQEISDALVARLLGDRAKQLQLLPSDQTIVPLSNYGPTTYSFQYQRLVNKIPYLNNGVTIQVSCTDGQITAYNLNWNEQQAPEAKDVINADQAQQAFANSNLLKLQYWMPAPYKPLLNGQKQDVKLVYQLSGQSGGAIDAFTGEALQLAQGDYLETSFSQSAGLVGSKGAQNSISPDAVTLTPQEQQEVDRTADLLKRDEAIAAVQRWISIPANLTLRNASLGVNWPNSNERIWSFFWSSTSNEEEGKVQALNASVSASTGELLNFSTVYQPSNGNEESGLDSTAAQKMAEEFLKKVQPERFNQVVLNPDSQQSGKLSGGFLNVQSFAYQRIANGVNFPDNGMNVNVDPVYGVTGYELNWSNADLPSVTGNLSQDKAIAAFLTARPLTLAYVRIYTKGLPGDLRLVYLPLSSEQTTGSSNVIDAKNGQMLDLQGQPLENGPKPYCFTDLTGVDEAQEIAALGQAGLFGDYGSSFRPSEKMSIGSLLKAMYLNRFGLWGNTSLTDDQIMAKAKEQGWLKEDLKAGDPVNREILAKVLLRYLQLNKLAELNGIYQVKFQDADQIDADALGYIALATSTGILEVNGPMLAPHESLNRSEAAGALFRALGWRS